MTKKVSNRNKDQVTKASMESSVKGSRDKFGDSVDSDASTDMRRKSGFNTTQVTWGVVFIFFGVLLLIDSLGVVSFQWTSLWRLWPLIVILLGVAILNIKGWLGALVVGMAITLSGGFALVALMGGIDNITDTEENSGRVSTFNVDRERNVDRADISIKSGAGKIEISDHRGGDLMSGELTSLVTQLAKKSEVSRGVQEVDISLKRGFQSWGINPTNNLGLSLTRSIPIDLSIDAGAASIRADLENIQARLVEVDAGASSIWLKLGDKQKDVNVDIDTGASSVDISIPKDAGVRLVLDGGMSSNDLPSDLNKVSGDTYESNDYSSSAVRFSINVDMGLSRFSLVRY